MDHAEAEATNATERYLLDELNAAEADAFEEHYFDCVECADDVRAGMALMEGGRKLVHETAEPSAAPVVSLDERRSRRWGWMQTAAAAAVLAIPLTIAALRMGTAAAPRVAVVDMEFLSNTTRAAGTTAPSVAQPAVLAFEIPPDRAYARYETRVVRSDGKVVQTENVPPDTAARGDVYVFVSGLAPGDYTLVLAGADTAGPFTEITSVRFNVKR